MPLGMLLAPGAGGGGGSSTSSAPYAGETFGNYFSNASQPSSSSPTSSNVTLVAGWEHGKNGGGRHLGPIQRSGLVRLGDRLVRINGKDVTDWTFREIMDALKDLVSASSQPPDNVSIHRKRLKALGFAPSGTAEWSRGTHHQPAATISESMFFGLFSSSLQHQQSSSNNDVSSARVVHSKRRYSFVSFIGRWRVAQSSDESLTGSNTGSLPLRQPQQQPILDSEHLEQQHRQNSENSNISEIERQLTKEPSIDYGDDHPLPDSTTVDERQTTMVLPPSELTNSSATNAEKPYIQYEIQCHILFRDTSSFQSHAPGISNTNNNIHHSWSVWKRFSELQTLDEELRYDFGWQMDVLNDERGIAFPSAHGLESWWYGVRNGGGVMTSLLGAGESSGSGGDTDVIKASGGADGGNSEHGGNIKEDGGQGSGLFAMFRTGPNGEDIAAKVNGNPKPSNGPNSNAEDTASNTSAVDGSSKCPFPPSFVERRRKELAGYWIDLMKIEDIFEFGDIHSHKFGKAMAKFLEVHKVLLSRKELEREASHVMASGNAQIQQHQHQLPQQHHHPSMALSSKFSFPAIHENEAEAFGTPSFATSAASLSLTREVSAGPMAIHDDDVSILSDGTGAFGDAASHNAPPRAIRGRPVVDVVPKQHSNNNGNIDTGGDNSPFIAPEDSKRVLSTSSVASSSVNSVRRHRSRAAAAPRAKPAFQRQFLSP
eukprot:CAMPEP_0181082918 /NCGR_PEP_ID=MMETSP1071-20121207/3878_1 /TAXON_ID=35127 /ORGANISM="Thalassiosira sp., Strain NH16" /LENGTH=712 /DNA_ID=CAMNT_0023164537 /DNA_START=134 /DNA_END=2272 /DNA_ORIENTATION=-